MGNRRRSSPACGSPGRSPRPNPERYWGAPESIVTDGRLATDSIPEDMSLLVDTDKGFVVVAGCGHAGTVNTVEYARRILGTEPAYAISVGCICSPPLTRPWPGRPPGCARPIWATCSARTAPGSRRSSGSGSWPRWTGSARWWPRSGPRLMRARGSIHSRWRSSPLLGGARPEVDATIAARRRRR